MSGKAFAAADWVWSAETDLEAAVARAKADAASLHSDKDVLKQLVGLVDLTTLAGDDTPDRVAKLYRRALAPVGGQPELRTAAVCVYPARVADVKAERDRLAPQPPVPAIASVAGGFPSGQYHLASRRLEVELAVADGADEIDIVIDRSLALQGRWDELHSEVSALKAACGSARLKTILSVGELVAHSAVYLASMAALFAGSDWIKTSTGKETVNANLPHAFVMLTAIKDYQKVGFKPAGGLKTAQDALEYYCLVKNVLGPEWLCPDLLRLGASSLLDNLAKDLH